MNSREEWDLFFEKQDQQNKSHRHLLENNRQILENNRQINRLIEEVLKEKKSAIAYHYFRHYDILIITFTFIIASLAKLFHLSVIFAFIPLYLFFYWVYRRKKVEKLFEYISDETLNKVLQANEIALDKATHINHQFIRIMTGLFLSLITCAITYNIYKNITFEYLAVPDHLVIIFSLLTFYILMLKLFFREELWKIFIPVVIIITVLYFNHIPNGIYQASFTRLDNKVVGEGTEENYPFELVIDNNNIQLPNDIILTRVDKLGNFYYDVYENGDNLFVLTKMGTLKVFVDGKYKADISVKY